jgi:2,3-bisphosphoglycerate-independent phosphoglycerate mutase
MTKSAGIKLNSYEEVIKEKAITAEIIQDYWRIHLNLDIPALSIEQAAQRVANVSTDYDVTLMEYYLTDKAGHEKDIDSAFLAIERLDLFLQHYMHVRPNNQTIVITSDHGNIEDLSVKTHTTNPVPLIVHGPKAEFFSEVSSIQDVTPAILRSLK